MQQFEQINNVLFNTICQTIPRLKKINPNYNIYHQGNLLRHVENISMPVFNGKSVLRCICYANDTQMMRSATVFAINCVTPWIMHGLKNNVRKKRWSAPFCVEIAENRCDYVRLTYDSNEPNYAICGIDA